MDDYIVRCRNKYGVLIADYYVKSLDEAIGIARENGRHTGKDIAILKKEDDVYNDVTAEVTGGNKL